MAKKIADKIFQAMNDLAEVRHLYVREEPKYDFTAAQKRKIKSRLGKVKKAVAFVEKKLK